MEKFKISVSGDGTKRNLADALIQLATEIECMETDEIEIENYTISAEVSLIEDEEE